MIAKNERFILIIGKYISDLVDIRANYIVNLISLCQNSCIHKKCKFAFFGIYIKYTTCCRCISYMLANRPLEELFIGYLELKKTFNLTILWNCRLQRAYAMRNMDESLQIALQFLFDVLSSPSGTYCNVSVLLGITRCEANAHN